MLPDLRGRSVAIVGPGQTLYDYSMAVSGHGARAKIADEIWAVGAAASGTATASGTGAAFWTAIAQAAGTGGALGRRPYATPVYPSPRRTLTVGAKPAHSPGARQDYAPGARGTHRTGGRQRYGPGGKQRYDA